MNPINVLQSTRLFAGTVATPSGEGSNTSPLIPQDGALFSSLLMGMTAEASAEMPAEQTETHPLLELLTAITDGLEDLQQGSESPEEQAIIHEALQFLALYGKQIEEDIKLLSQTAVKPPTAQTDQRVTEMISPEKMEVVELIRQLGQELQVQKPAAATALTPLTVKEGQGPETLAVLPKLVELLKKSEILVNEFRQQTSNDQMEKPLFIARAEPFPMRPVVELASPAATAIPLERVEVEIQPESRQVPLATEAIKSSLVPQRSEPNAAPLPTVRMSNLAEELGEVLRNSMRLTSSGETNQIRVNIFPEHLGHLDIRITEQNGRLSAQILTGSLAAKDALELQVNLMRQTLLQQGIIIEKIDIIQQSSQHSMGQQQAQADQRFAQQQQRKGNASRDSTAYTNTEEETAAMRSQVPEGLLKVDYTV